MPENPIMTPKKLPNQVSEALRTRHYSLELLANYHTQLIFLPFSTILDLIAQKLRSQ